MFTSSKAKNDCVLTAISNLTGKPYTEVWQAREDCNGTLQNHKNAGATINSKIPDIVNKLGYRVVIDNGLPCDNQACLFSYTSGPRSKCGHMVAVIDGYAIEDNGFHWSITNRRLWNRKSYYLYPLS